MASLRQFLFGYAEETTVPQELAVYNTSTTSVNNGGRCCLWTVPAGTSYAIFELWGGGASGDGGCCCQMGYPSTSGSYGQKALDVEQKVSTSENRPLETITISISLPSGPDVYKTQARINILPPAWPLSI